MTRRAERLLRFLRDQNGLSAPRRTLLAPLFCGLMQRAVCPDLAATLPFRLGLDEHETLNERPELVARLWSDASLATPILKWAYSWLQERRIQLEVTPDHVRRFVLAADAEMALEILPLALQSGAIWPDDFNLVMLSDVLQGEMPGADAQNAAFLAERGRIVTLFARFPNLIASDDWLRDSLGEVRDEITVSWAKSFLQRRVQIADFALVSRLSPPLRAAFNAALFVAFPLGLSLDTWNTLADSPELAPPLSPALRELPLASEVANFLWSLGESGAPWIAALGEAHFNAAFNVVLREQGRALNWVFLPRLSASHRAIYFAEVALAFPAGLERAAWTALSQISIPKSGIDLLPLSDGFWGFLLPLDSPTRAMWLDLVTPARAARDFSLQPAATFAAWLESDVSGLEMLGNAWLDRNLSELAPDSEILLQLAQSEVSSWQERALAHLSAAPLRLSAALRLMESELPALQSLARPYFETQNPGWSDNILALADSPNASARRFALDFLARFPERWTPELLGFLAQHDGPGVQAFVAAQLEKVPDAPESSAFDQAILNARGRSRRAKNSVQNRLAKPDSEAAPPNEALLQSWLDAARNGAPRDRAWALQQLVRASLEGVSIPEIGVEGAVARASRR